MWAGCDLNVMYVNSVYENKVWDILLADLRYRFENKLNTFLLVLCMCVWVFMCVYMCACMHAVCLYLSYNLYCSIIL